MTSSILPQNDMALSWAGIRHTNGGQITMLLKYHRNASLYHEKASLYQEICVNITGILYY